MRDLREREGEGGGMDKVYSRKLGRARCGSDV